MRLHELSNQRANKGAAVRYAGRVCVLPGLRGRFCRVRTTGLLVKTGYLDAFAALAGNYNALDSIWTFDRLN